MTHHLGGADNFSEVSKMHCPSIKGKQKTIEKKNLFFTFFFSFWHAGPVRYNALARTLLVKVLMVNFSTTFDGSSTIVLLNRKLSIICVSILGVSLQKVSQKELF
jgi:hypothetical protein